MAQGFTPSPTSGLHTATEIVGGLNTNDLAILTGNSGASAPSPTYPLMWWNDATNSVVKRRKADDSGWSIIGTLNESPVVSRGTNTVIGVSDYGLTIYFNGTFTQTLTAAATLGNGFYLDLYNDSTGLITIDPAGIETINGATTLALVPGASGRLYCTGTKWIFLSGDAHQTTAKATPVDADELSLQDSVANYGRAKVLWSAVKATLKTYFDTLYSPVSGGTPGLVKLASGSASAQATLDIVMTSYTAYKNKLLVLDSFLPASNQVDLYLRVSTDGGSSYSSGALYNWGNIQSNTNVASTSSTVGANSSTQITLIRGVTVAGEAVGNGAAQGFSGQLEMFHTTSTSLSPRFLANMVHITDGTFLGQTRAVGMFQTAQDTDAVRLLFSSGNIASGNWTLYGYA
jgi:hypothetical protein